MCGIARLSAAIPTLQLHSSHLGFCRRNLGSQMTSLLLQAALGLPLSTPRVHGAPQPCVNRRAALSTLPAAALVFPRAAVAAATPLSAKEISVKLRPIPVCGVFVNGDQPIFTDSDMARRRSATFTSSRPTRCPPSSRRRQTTKASASAWCRSPTCTTSWATSRSAARCACGRRARRWCSPTASSYHWARRSSTRRRGRCRSSSERVALTSEGGADEFPFFFDKEDLDATFGRLQQGELPVGDVKVVTLGRPRQADARGRRRLRHGRARRSRASLALSRQLKGGADGLGRQ